MDLALVTGRGEPLGTEWPGVDDPLVADADVVQLGERQSRDAHFAWPDVNDTAVATIDVFQAAAIGVEGVAARIFDMLAAGSHRGFWVRLDVDVLDQAEISQSNTVTGVTGTVPNGTVDRHASTWVEAGWLDG